MRSSDSVPMELVEFKYREKFHLSNAEMEVEPMDKFRINLEIMSLEAMREKMEYKEAERSSR